MADEKKKGFIAEFKAFISKGNVMDMAVGIIIGVAFGAVINSMVNDMLMPPVGLAMGGADFQESYVVLKGADVNGTTVTSFPSLAAAKAAGAVTLRFGVFINTLINFIIIALVIFMIVKVMATAQAKAKKLAETEAKEEAKKVEATQKKCPFCDTDISLKATRCPHCTSKLEEKEKKDE